jgi:hypothetical protein
MSYNNMLSHTNATTNTNGPSMLLQLDTSSFSEEDEKNLEQFSRLSQAASATADYHNFNLLSQNLRIFTETDVPRASDAVIYPESLEDLLCIGLYRQRLEENNQRSSTTSLHPTATTAGTGGPDFAQLLQQQPQHTSSSGTTIPSTIIKNKTDDHSIRYTNAQPTPMTTHYSTNTPATQITEPPRMNYPPNMPSPLQQQQQQPIHTMAPMQQTIPLNKQQQQQQQLANQNLKFTFINFNAPGHDPNQPSSQELLRQELSQDQVPQAVQKKTRRKSTTTEPKPKTGRRSSQAKANTDQQSPPSAPSPRNSKQRMEESMFGKFNAYEPTDGSTTSTFTFVPFSKK